MEIPTLTAESLLRSYQVDGVGLLVIDTEGFDKIVLDQFLTVSKPAVILCEIAHVPHPDQTWMLRRLAGLGYAYCLVDGVRDVLAIRADAIPPQTR